MWKARLLVTVLSLGHVTCHGALFTASPGSTIQLIPNPRFISVNGGVSLITAIVTEAAGTFVPDGTIVLFFTDLGRVDAQARTKDGIARVNLVADSRSGTAKVLAISGGPAPAASGGGASGTNSAETEVTVGNTNAVSILVTANPPKLGSGRFSFVTATVFDARGNVLQGSPVFFSVVTTPNPGTEFFESGGAPIFTDHDGRATDVLRTRAVFPGVVVRIAKIRASVPSGGASLLTGELDIPVD